MTLIQTKIFGKPTFWFLALSASLAAIYVTLLSYTNDESHLGMSVLFGLAIASLLWDRRHKLKLDSNVFSCTLGFILVVAVLGISPWLLANIHAYPSVLSADLSKLSNQVFVLLRLMPFFAGLGVALLATRLTSLQMYWRELVLVFFMGVPSVLVNLIVDFSPATARFAMVLLSALGFDATLANNTFVMLSDGGVEVKSGCSGAESIIYCLSLSILFLIMFPIARKRMWLIPLIASAIGFTVNSIRVALLAVLVSLRNQEAFEYWHEGRGGLIFSLISITLLIAFYIVFSKQTPTPSPHLGEGKQASLKVPLPERERDLG